MGYKKRTLTLAGTVSTAAADLIQSTEVTDFASFSVQVGGTAGNTIGVYGSNDNATWVALRAQNAQDATSIVGAITQGTLVRGPLLVRYLKVTSIAVASGTVTAALLLSPDTFATVVKST